MCKYKKNLKFLGCYASNFLRNDKRKTFCSYRIFGICLLKKQAALETNGCQKHSLQKGARNGSNSKTKSVERCIDLHTMIGVIIMI